MDELTDDDLIAASELDRRSAENPQLGREVTRALAIGFLAEGIRRSGRWARQLQLGTLSILVVRHDPAYLRRVHEQERYVCRLRSSRS